MEPSVKLDRPEVKIFIPYEAGARNWGHEIVIAKTDQYLGKILLMNAGCAGNLQYHTEKEETFFLYSGKCYVDSVKDGQLVRVEMSEGYSYHIPPGAPHRVTAITDCVFMEVSTPHLDDRVRCEAEYGEPEVVGLPSTR
jgi:mannose-6-phosphate isomerase-like protein (cupin superfamily)